LLYYHTMDDPIKKQRYQELSKLVRFYKREYPESDEYVYAFVSKFTDIGISCYLPEYKKEAFLSYKDASSSRKLRNIKKDVIKNRYYVLTTINIDETKGFIDVDKRSVDKSIEDSFSSLILFYQRIFNIFIQAFIFKYPHKTIDEVYDFLDKTLWKADPKEIKKNMLSIHQDTDFIREKYNLNDETGTDILQTLLNTISKPVIKQTIKLKINSLALRAVEDIREFISKLEQLLHTTFVIYSAPLYVSYINVEYDSTVSNDSLKNKLTTEVQTYIDQYDKDKLYIVLDEISIDLIQESN
jgi:translation initiation factor 2 alpha subunit (eIF-2alpha)